MTALMKTMIRTLEVGETLRISATRASEVDRVIAKISAHAMSFEVKHTLNYSFVKRLK